MVQYLADWVRITLLYKYGGVWFDASVICTSKVEKWMANAEEDGGTEKITMFPMHANPKVHGNWTMAVPSPGHPLLKAWREEFALTLRQVGPRCVPIKFCTEAFEQYPNLTDIWHGQSASGVGPPLPYLWVYLCLQVVLQKQPELHATIYLRPSITGPMYRRYLINIEEGITDSSELSERTAQHLATNPLAHTEYDQFFIKLVGSDRHPIQCCLDSGGYKEGSAIDYLSQVPQRSIKFGSYLKRSVETSLLSSSITKLRQIKDEASKDDEVLDNFDTVHSTEHHLTDREGVVLEEKGCILADAGNVSGKDDVSRRRSSIATRRTSVLVLEVIPEAGA